MPKPHYDSIAYWAVGILVCYVLSLGPVCALCRHHYLSPNYCEPIYRPLEFMHFDTMPVVEPALNAYVDWCSNL